MAPTVFFAFFGLDSVGFPELTIFFAVLLIVVGPRNLPSAVRKFGEVMGKLRRAAEEFKRQLMQMENELKAAERRAEAAVAEAVTIPEEPPAPMGGELPPGALAGAAEVVDEPAAVASDDVDAVRADLAKQDALDETAKDCDTVNGAAE